VSVWAEGANFGGAEWIHMKAYHLLAFCSASSLLPAATGGLLHSLHRPKNPGNLLHEGKDKERLVTASLGGGERARGSSGEGGKRSPECSARQLGG